MLLRKALATVALSAATVLAVGATQPASAAAYWRYDDYQTQQQCQVAGPMVMKHDSSLKHWYCAYYTNFPSYWRLWVSH